MKKLSFVSLLVTLTFSTTVYADSCEKWKSEIGSAVVHLAKYGKAYLDKSNEKISGDRFDSVRKDTANQLEKLLLKTKSVPSCSHPDNKFEIRKEKFQSILNYAIPAVRYGDKVADSVKEQLKNLKDN